MALFEDIYRWENKKVLIIGEALIDKYIFGFADKISPDAPVPNVKIEKSNSYLGGIGLVLKYIKSLGGIPEICTIVGNDYEGDFFLKEIKSLNLNSSGIIVDDKINTPQITRVKAMNQHLLRLETDYSNNISKSTIEDFFKIFESRPKKYDSIIVLDYGIGGLFEDIFIQRLLVYLEENYKNIPIIARPNLANYYLYENIEIIKMTLQKALQTLSIDCCTPTSVTIVGKKILNASNCKNVLLNDIESKSYLFSKDSEKLIEINTILQGPVTSYVAVGSVIMAILGLGYAAKISAFNTAKIAIYAASLSASLPPVDFLNSENLLNFIQTCLDKE
ncbi:MAG: bifunctional heptose 7-phosphate kinase/heptose 1-phosphate adenyltransferase [Promethearchaeota archaeon]